MVATDRLVIVGDLEAACGWAARLAGQRAVTVVSPSPAASDSEWRDHPGFAIEHGGSPRLDGHLGAFRLTWHCGTAEESAVFDVVLDLSPEPLLRQAELPSGYAVPGRDPLDQALAVIELLGFVGEFERPRYVNVKERLCAHGRSQKTGCRNCLDVCATAAIASAGDTIRVDPYLCQGCGTCTTVCPSGALAYQYPRVADVGRAVKAQLAAYRNAGGTDACLLFHSAQGGSKALAALARGGRALPDNVIAVETWSADALGLDLLLGCVALGAGRVAVLGAGSHDLAVLCRQAALGQAILGGLGYVGEYLRIIDSEHGDWVAELSAWAPPPSVPPAEFHLLADKRTTLEFVVDHLLRHAPARPDSIELPAGAPFGAVLVSDACTLCMSCVGACPAGVLKAAAEAPRLSFLERNCVQCGLCVHTCPEQALQLQPRLLLKDRRQERVLREAEIFCCASCGKPMGAKPVIDSMLARLAGHSMFATPQALARLRLCADCRVVDLINHEDSLKASEMSE